MKSSVNTILIAEDHDDSRKMFRFFLEQEGFRIVEARSGREAIEFAILVQPDLILMDLNMPEIDGLTAAIEIRNQPNLSNIPILANSGDGNRGIDFFAAIDKLGKAFVGYIAKPCSLDELLFQINSILDQRREISAK